LAPRRAPLDPGLFITQIRWPFSDAASRWARRQSASLQSARHASRTLRTASRGPSGIVDLTTLAVGETIGRQLDHPAAVAHASPDGHALLLMSNANAVSAAMVRQPGYDPVSHRSARGAISTRACSPPVLAASRRGPTCWLARGQAS
jgi:hypothetical protein